MKVYGIRIGALGLEFPSREDREKAIITITRSSSVEVSDSGLRYKESRTAFGTYERNTEELAATCCKCSGIFSTETCPNREYPHKWYGQKEWHAETGYICDACFAKITREKEVDEAKAVLNQEA